MRQHIRPNDLSGDMSRDLPIDESWEVAFQQTHPTVELTKPYTFDIAFSGIGEPANPNSKWTLTSKTAANHSCDALLSQQMGTSVQLAIPANADPRCADELTLSVTVNEDAMAQIDIEVTLPIDVVTKWTADANNTAWDTARETPSIRWNVQTKTWDMWYLASGAPLFKQHTKQLASPITTMVMMGLAK